ncbi:MAG: iron-containing alcohol dehydrogenase, partial [Actinobacteria bacterium]|nr:iron-containing alcohol dehydrogenase [Actinomycetota bacterium]
FFLDPDADEVESARSLTATLQDLGLEHPYVIASRHGETLAAALSGARAPHTSKQGADQTWAAELGGLARSEDADSIVAIGGGRRLDVAKLAAARAGLTLIAVPTQLSHDGICSPVAVVPNDEGRAESLGAVAPRAVIIPLGTLAHAPVASVAAGLGDLLANPLALRDWALASERGLEDIDERAWDLSTESFDAIAAYLDEDPAVSERDPAFLKHLADALVLSGMSMICSGTSRPASGGEHEISHAIDEIFGGRALHGAQVAFGTLISMALYEDDVVPTQRRLRTLGLPAHPRDLELTTEDVVEVILAAPDTRPGRFTILEEANLDRTKAHDLVEVIWPE